MTLALAVGDLAPAGSSPSVPNSPSGWRSQARRFDGHPGGGQLVDQCGDVRGVGEAVGRVLVGVDDDVGLPVAFSSLAA